MSPVKNLRILSALLLLNFTYFNIYAQSSACLNNDVQKDMLKDQYLWKEIESKREIFSSTYKTPDNRIIIHYSKQPLNYYNAEGKLVPVNINPVQSEKGYSSNDQPNKLSVLNDGSIEFRTPDRQLTGYSKNCKINGVNVITSDPQYNDGKLTMRTNIPEISKTFEFRFNSLEYSYVINKPVTTSSVYYTITEELDLPGGSIIEKDAAMGKTGKQGWQGSLLINDNKNNTIGSLRGVVCYDANHNYITAAYKISNEKKEIQILVPVSWLNDPSRNYPVTIDPLITGPTTTYTGSLIPSCISPNSGSDSILVTIPAQITVTGLIVSGSFYADPFSTAIMNDGAMYFSTSCGTTSNYTTTGAAGSSPGTAYLTAANLKSPLTCCFSQSCSVQTFYLSMHITRTVGGSGCNTNYIYHDPNGAYPFSAYVEGYTVEAFGPGYTIGATNLCSNECEFNGATYARYGVPPFTVSHPWMTGSINGGTPGGCTTASVISNLNLTIPNCPVTCDTTTAITVPPPTITDACGNSVTGLVSKTITITQVPEVTAIPDTITICSGDTFSTALTSCIPGSTINWSGNSTGGTGAVISQSLTNTGSSIAATNYEVYAENNSCLSDTITVSVNTTPVPSAALAANPNPAIINVPVSFSDNSTVYGGASTNWFWTFGDGSFSNQQNPTHSYSEPGTYHVCLQIETTEGCVDSLCSDVEIIAAELVLPNVSTPNADNMNDFLYFENLEFFGTNNLKVFNRWGQLIYEKDNYSNDWSPKSLSDGTYYYILTLQNGEIYKSYLQILH